MTEHGAPRERDVQIVQALLDGKRELTKEFMQARQRMEPRRFRAAVSELRRRGYPVVSDSAEGSTYRKAKTQEELEAFIEAELVSRARVLEGQIRALREAAPRYFGVAEQLALVR